MTESLDENYRAPRSGYQGHGHIIYEDVRVFSLSQRINRLRYACYSLTTGFIAGLLIALVMILSKGLLSEKVGNLVSMVSLAAIGLVTLIYLMTLLVRRLHDVGKTGWMSVVFLAPFLNIPLMMFSPQASTLAFILNITSPFFALYLFAAAGDGMNRFGTPNPPNSVLVKVFGGFCWILNVLVLLLQLALMSLQYAAPTQLQDMMQKLPIDQRVLQRTMQQY